MNEIKCPHCGEVFKVDASGYADIVKQVRDIIEISAPASEVGAVLSKKKLDKTQRLQRIAILRKQMKEAATMLEFELAADLRDQIRELEAQN